MNLSATLRPELNTPASHGANGDVLHRVALTVNSSLDIKEVLERLARLALEAIPADRCNLFLVDSTRRYLEPALSIGHTSDPGLWQRFRALEPIDLRAVPERWALFTQGRALGIEDMAVSAVVPDGIAETFRARAGLLAPLLAAGEPVGLLSLDWSQPGRVFPDHERALFEAIASYAALAVRNARLYEGLVEKNQVLERLVELAGALTSEPSLAAVLRLVSSAFEELLGATHCSVNVLAEAAGGFETLESRGVPWRSPETLPDAVSPAEIARVTKFWETDPKPVVYRDVRAAGVIDPDAVPDGLACVALFPLAQDDCILGAVVAGFERPGRLAGGLAATGQALADLAAAAIARANMDQALRSRYQELEAVYRLSDVMTGAASLPTAMRRLNKAFGPDCPFRFDGVAVMSGKVREAVGGREPSTEDAAAVKQWRADIAARRPLRSRPGTRGLLVPVARERRVLGALRVAPVGHVGRDDEALLVAVGKACADVIQKADLRRQLGDREHRLVVAAERDRIARDLHDSVGQTITAIGLRLSQFLPEAPDRTWRQRLTDLLGLADRSSQDIRQAIHALLFLEIRGRSLEDSLRTLARQFQASTGIATSVTIRSLPTAPGSEVAEALFRVAREALANVERHARATSVSLVVTGRPGELTMAIRDDGVGLGMRDPFGKAGHFGLRAMQIGMQAVGGSVTVGPASPRGVLVEASAPTSKGTARR